MPCRDDTFDSAAGQSGQARRHQRIEEFDVFHRRELSGVLSLCRTTIRRPAHAEEIAPGGQFTCIGAGRTFEVILARGQEVSAEDQDAAWAMLNSFIPVAIESAP